MADNEIPAMQAAKESDDLVFQAEKYLEEENFREALDILVPFLQKNPEDLFASLLMGRTALGVGDKAIAEKYYLQALDISGNDPEYQEIVMTFFYGQGEHKKALPYVKVLMKMRPEHAGYMEFFGDICYTLNYLQEALDSFLWLVDRHPDNPRFLFRSLMCQDVKGTTGDGWEKFFAFDEIDASVLLAAANWLLRQRDFPASKLAFERYVRAIDPGDPVDSFFHARFGDVHRGLGDMETARSLYKQALDISLDRLSAGSMSFEFVGIWLYANFVLVGKDRARKAFQESLGLTGGKVNFEKTVLPDGNHERIDLLQSMCQGKDVVILLPGPSIADFSEQIEGLRGSDCLFFGLNECFPIEKNVLSKLDRNFDGVIQSNPYSVRVSAEYLADFMERPNNILLANLYCLLGLPDDRPDMDEFLEEYKDKILMFTSNRGSPPNPYDPLQMMAGNTLSALTTLLILGAPRRIFIFGADAGGKKAGSGTEPAYYFPRGPEVPADHVQTAQFLRDTREMEALMDIILTGVSELFGVPIPPIYNCCPHSSITVFDKIRIDEGIGMIAEGP